VTRLANLYRGLAIAAIATAAVGGPLIEVLDGFEVFADLVPPQSRRDVTNGSFARRVDGALARETATDRQLGPIYRELLYATTGRTATDVVKGEDGWLFYAPTVVGYPPPAGYAALPGVTKAIGDYVRWLKSLGCTTYLMVVPNKASVVPEKVGERAPPFRPAYAHALEALRRSGVPSVDLLPALREPGAIHYLERDTHWNTIGALRCIDAIAALVKRDRVLPLDPGAPSPYAISQRGMKRGEGGLLRMLGLRKGSSLYESLLEESPIVLPVEKASGSIYSPPERADVVLGGTSFSHDARSAGLLAVRLGVPVENLAAPGWPLPVPALALAQQIVLEGRAPPKVFVWEFPERLLFLFTDQARLPLESVLRLAKVDLASLAPLPPPQRAVGLVREARKEGAEAGAASRYVPAIGVSFLEWRFEPPLAGDGTLSLVTTIETTSPTICALHFDTGAGFNDGNKTEIVGQGFAQTIALPILTASRKPIHGIRLLPQRTGKPFEMTDPAIGKSTR
jgi:hypothetical protein